MCVMQSIVEVTGWSDFRYILSIYPMKYRDESTQSKAARSSAGAHTVGIVTARNGCGDDKSSV